MNPSQDGMAAAYGPRSRGAERAGSLAWLGGALLAASLAACSAGHHSSSPSSGGGLFTTAPQAGGGVGGSVVAELELSAPSASTFVLRGTFPVPKGTYPRADKKEPFSVRNYDGQVVPTQVEIVSRYPLDQDGADVVEVLARVDVPPGTPPETRLRYEVVNNPHMDGKLPVKQPVLQLATKPGQVLLVAHDVFGHRYDLDLLADVRASVGGQGPGKVMRQGSGAVTIRTYGVMEPDPAAPKGAPNGALPHLFGAHTYFTAWAWSDVVSLDLRINNAASGLDKQTSEDDPLGRAYFESLEVWVPKGWTLVPDVIDPYWGTTRDEGSWTAYELVRPLAGGKLHVMPAQANMIRRLALVESGKEPLAQSLLAAQWVGYNQRGYAPGGAELYSWWNRSTPGYFPQKHRLAELDFVGYGTLASDLLGKFNSIRNYVVNGQGTGTYPHQADVMGWSHPYGTAYGGMTGGSEIFLYDGFQTAEVGSSVGYRTYEILNRMYASRQPDKLFDKDGEPSCVEGWVINGPQFKYVNMNFFQKLMPGSNDPFGMATSPGFQRSYVNSMGLAAPYESELDTYAPIDFQHYIRYTRAPKVLAWLGNDPLAKDELRAAAEVFRMSYHQYYTTPAGGTTVSQFLPDKQYVTGTPAKGFTFGRGEAWGMDAAIAAYSTGDPAWRALTKPWIDQVADTLTNGQSACNKMIQSNVQAKALGGAYQVRQSIEQAITENMLYGMIASVHRDADPGRAAALSYTLQTSTEGMIGPMCWSDGSLTGGKVGPHGYMAVAPLNNTLPPYCGSLPSGGFGNGVDQYQVWSSFAYGYELTGNASFHGKASAMAGGGGSLWNQMTAMGMQNLENRLALLADLQ